MISQGFLGNLRSIKSTPQSYVQAWLDAMAAARRTRLKLTKAHILRSDNYLCETEWRFQNLRKIHATLL